MAKYGTVRIGDVLSYDEQDCTVEAVMYGDRDHSPMLRLHGLDGTRYTVGVRTLAETVVARENKEEATDEDRRVLLSGIPEAAAEQAIERFHQLRDITERLESGQSDEGLDQIIRSKASELGVSERNLWRRWSAYQEQGLWGLVDKRRLMQSDGLDRIDERLRDAMLAAAQDETEDSTGTRKRLFRRTKRILDERFGAGVVPLPSMPTFNRYCTELFAGRHTLGQATTRRSTAASPDGPFSTLVALRPGEIVEFDTTRFDVLAWDVETNTSYAVELTLAMDLCTRSLLAWRFTPVGTKAVDAALLLADMLNPEPMRDHWPDSLRLSALQLPIDRMATLDERIEFAAARPIILPETVRIDHGKVFLSRAFLDACGRLGISVAPARLGQASDKTIERVFGTIRTQFAEHLSGYKSNNVVNRGSDPEGRALWTIAEIEEFFAEYVVAVYQRRRHEGLVLPGFPNVQLSPNLAYAEAIGRSGIIALPPDPQLYFELLPTEWVRVNAGGVIRIRGLQYLDEGTHRLARTRSSYEAKDGKWPAKYDPRDRNFIYFQDPESLKWRPVRWRHAADETRPFTDRTYDFVRRHLRDRGTQSPTETDVAAALEELQNRTDLPVRDAARHKRRAIRDSERARHAGRDRTRGGLVAVPYEADQHEEEPVDEFFNGEIEAAPLEDDLGDLP